MIMPHTPKSGTDFGVYRDMPDLELVDELCLYISVN